MGLSAKFRKIALIFAVLMTVGFVIQNFNAQNFVIHANEAHIHAETHILIEAESGRVLHANGEHRLMFPAATTMILTAILAVEFLGMDELIVVGDEITFLPSTSANNGHQIGEVILGKNLIRSMLIGTGNDAANVVAVNVARRVSGEENMPFGQAGAYFARLMTEKAAELGALNTNFVNAHGFHHDNHVTTAYDMALIARHAAGIETITDITSQAAFRGTMDGESGTPRRWDTANQLITPGGPNFYPYAFGLRTGHFPGLAGYTLAAAARKDGITLIAVALNSPLLNDVETRWQDAITLFNYGFETYAYRTLLTPFETLGQLTVYNPRLGDEDILEFAGTLEIEFFLSLAEYERLMVEFEFFERFVTYGDSADSYENESVMFFVGPVEYLEEIGSVNYWLDGELLFSVPIHASREVLERTTASDIDFHTERFIQTFFSRQSVPYWVAALSVLCLLTLIGFLLRNRIREKRKYNKYKIKL